MAARWKMSSGRAATSFSASPGAERSEVTQSVLNDAPAGAARGTTSCRGTEPISSPATLPSFARPAASLPPIMPAPPMIRTRFTSCSLPVLASPVWIPDPPPRRVSLDAAGGVVRAVREVLAHHALGGIAQVRHAERVVGPDQDEEGLLDGRRLRGGLDRVLRAVRRGDVGR